MDRELKLEANRITLSFPYTDGMVQRIKALPLRTWDNDAKLWCLPRTASMAKIAIAFGTEHHFTIDGAVIDLANSKPKRKQLDRSVLYPYQHAAVDFAHQNNGTFLNGDDLGCVDGDMEIVINRAGVGRRYKLSKVYERMHGAIGRYSWDKTIPTTTRSVTESTGELRLNRMLDIVDKGMKQVLIIRTLNHTVTVTPDHEIWTPSGWIRADHLQQSNSIYVNGNHNYIDSEGYIRVGNMKKHPHVCNGEYVVQHRLVWEAFQNDVSYERWVEMGHTGYDRDDYEFLSNKILIHHKDENKQNNKLDNLEPMSIGAHARLHLDINNVSEFFQVKEEQITSIEGLDKPIMKRVYDVIMESPRNSFVANSIVVHNCGKTIESLWYAKEADVKNMLVVCPASVLFKWQDECKRWTGWDSQVVLTSKQPLLDSRVTIMSYAIMTRRAHELVKHPYELAVFDEAHALANASKRSSAAKLVCANKKMFLSGTPFLNRPIELFNILNMISPLAFPNYWAYAQKYCAAQQIQMGDRKFWNVNGASNLDELKKKLDLLMIRRTRQEVSKDLPALTRNILPVDISNKSEYRLAYADLKEWLKQNDKNGVATALTKLNYLRQIMGAGKVASAIELAEEVLQSDPKRKLVIYAHHKEVVKQLLLALKEWGVATIVGDDSPMQRSQVNKMFQENAIPRVLIISSAGGMGIDLFRADTMIFVEREWNPGTEEQGEGRIHRQGQTNPVSIYYLVARNTVDEDIADLIESKRKVFGTLIGSQDIQTELLERL